MKKLVVGSIVLVFVTFGWGRHGMGEQVLRDLGDGATLVDAQAEGSRAGVEGEPG